MDKNVINRLNDSKPFREVFKDCPEELYSDKEENKTVSRKRSLYIILGGLPVGPED